MAGGEDSGVGVLPAIPESAAEVGRGLIGLSYASPAGPGRFLVEGARARVTGIQSREGGEVTFPPEAATTPSRDATRPTVPRVILRGTGTGHAANLLLFPGLSRRDFVGSAGTALETIVVAPALPLVVWQFSAQSADPIPPIVGDLVVGGSSPRVERADRGVALHTDGTCVAVGVVPPPTSLEFEEVEGGFRFTIRPATQNTTTLLFAAGPPKDVRTALQAGAHIQGHALRAMSGPEDGLVLASGISELDEGVAWARSRLRGLVASEDSDPLMPGLAALVTGERDAAAQALRYATPAHPNTAALLAARFASVLGDPSAASRTAERWTAEGAEARVGALAALAAGQLADGLQYAAPPAVIAALRKALKGTSPVTGPVRGPATGARVPRQPMSLPVVGRAQPASPASSDSATAAWLASLLKGDPVEPGPRTGGDVDFVRSACARFRTNPDSAWIDWRQSLTTGFVDGADGPATWGSSTADLLLALVHGLLGLDHDAPVGRLRLAPRLPSHLTSFAVRGIALGDASLRLEYERAGSNHHFELTPEFASVPPLIVFEPTVAGSVREVSIDGAPAELSSRASGGLSVVPVQLPLDGARTLDIVTG